MLYSYQLKPDTVAKPIREINAVLKEKKPTSNN